jgi:hypothetical protein
MQDDRETIQALRRDLECLGPATCMFGSAIRRLIAQEIARLVLLPRINEAIAMGQDGNISLQWRARHESDIAREISEECKIKVRLGEKLLPGNALEVLAVDQSEWG